MGLVPSSTYPRPIPLSPFLPPLSTPIPCPSLKAKTFASLIPRRSHRVVPTAPRRGRRVGSGDGGADPAGAVRLPEQALLPADGRWQPLAPRATASTSRSSDTTTQSLVSSEPNSLRLPSVRSLYYLVPVPEVGMDDLVAVFMEFEDVLISWSSVLTV
jgi:hypothetical protein